MTKVFIRTVDIKAVEAWVTYPFYRSDQVGDDHVNYWKFESPARTWLLSKQGNRTVLIDYNEGNDGSTNTQLTRNLLDAINSVSIIDKDSFDKVVNAHIVELLRLYHPY